MRVSLFLIIVAAGLTAQIRAQTPGAAPGNAETGKKTYADRACWMCHGFAAQGGEGPGGPRLAGRVPEWPRFSKYVRRPTDDMIPYPPKVLSDQELADIYAWLKSLPPPPAVSSIPQLKD
jgi:mono/diheme cytochrome c family protein